MLKQRLSVFLIVVSLLTFHFGCGETAVSPSNSNAASGTVYRADGAQTKTIERRQPSRASKFSPSLLNLFEINDDIELGKESAKKMTEQVTLINDEEIVGYVTRLGKGLTVAAPGHDYPYEFQVIASKAINAFALPGGTIFVNAGAIMSAKNEAELAGVIAHEIAHVALRHGTAQATKVYSAMAVKDILDRVTGGDSTQIGRAINAIGGLGANVVFLKFGRDAEREADLEGARIMSELEYDPNDLANFFLTLEAESKEQGPEFLSDHPNPGNRVAAIRNEIGSLRINPNPVRSSEEFERVKAKLKSGSIPLNSRGPSRTGPEN